jgi:hypothetical protein
MYGYVFPLSRTKSLIVLSPKNYPLSFLRFFSNLNITKEDVENLNLEEIYNMQIAHEIVTTKTSSTYDSILSTHVPYVDFPLFPFIENHSNENLAYLFRHVLLENSLLIVTPHPNLGVLFLESLKALLFPFTWPHVEVPVSNRNWMHFLEAPGL